MINGIIFFETGGIQQIGDLSTISHIIETIKKILPELEKKERDRIFDTLSTEEIAQIIKDREAANK